jgi:hypothetical protein
MACGRGLFLACVVLNASGFDLFAGEDLLLPVFQQLVLRPSEPAHDETGGPLFAGGYWPPPNSR